MESNDQKQTVKDGAVAVQAGRDVVIGATPSEMVKIAQEIFNSNFYQLAAVAKEIATNRSNEIIGKFLEKLQRENPDGLKLANDPDIQYALFTVQKQYARTGDKDLGDLLVELLVDRTKQPQRNLLQIVLTESLEIAPKLTEQQLAALSLTFLFRYTQNRTINSHADLGLYFDRFVAPFAPKIVKNDATYQHLEFSGCGASSVLATNLATILGNPYQGLFMRGFTMEEFLNQKGASTETFAQLLVPCVNDPTKLQIRGLNVQDLDVRLNALGLAESARNLAKQYFMHNKMPDDQIKTTCVGIRGYMASVFDTWEGSPINHFTLTSVGMAIAHANIHRLVGRFADLAIWLTEAADNRAQP